MKNPLYMLALVAYAVGIGVFAVDPPGPAPSSVQEPPLAPPTIILPDVPAEGTPRIFADVYYVIRSDVPCFILSSPDLRVKIVETSGPQNYKGHWVDKPGAKSEKRTFTEKYIYEVEPLKTGPAEIIVIPQGVSDAKFIKRQTVLVDMGDGPIPPPDPDAAFKARLKAAFDNDGNDKKGEFARSLAALYSEAARTTVKDKKIETVEALYTAMQTAGSTMVPLPGLEACRRVIADELRTKLPVPVAGKPTTLTDSIRETCGEQYTRMGKLLEELK